MFRVQYSIFLFCIGGVHNSKFQCSDVHFLCHYLQFMVHSQFNVHCSKLMFKCRVLSSMSMFSLQCFMSHECTWISQVHVWCTCVHRSTKWNFVCETIFYKFCRLTRAWQYFGTLTFELFLEILRTYVDKIIFLFLC